VDIVLPQKFMEFLLKKSKLGQAMIIVSEGVVTILAKPL
jgi:hypothetical protein